MTDIALHQLPDSGPLTGAEIVPIDDGTATVKTTVSALRAGLAAATHSHASAAIADSTATGRALLTAATASDARGALGLGSLAQQNAAVTADAAQGLALRNLSAGGSAACRLTLGSNADDSDAYVQLNSGGNASHGGARSLNILANAGDICFLAGRLNPTLRLRILNGGGVAVGSATVFDSAGHASLRSYTVATLPTASPAGRLIHVSDGAAGRRLAVSTGGGWSWTDGTAVA